MTISELIARLTELQKQVGSSAQVKLGNAYSCTERPFDYFTIHKSPDNKHVSSFRAMFGTEKSEIIYTT